MLRIASVFLCEQSIAVIQLQNQMVSIWTISISYILHSPGPRIALQHHNPCRSPFLFQDLAPLEDCHCRSQSTIRQPSPVSSSHNMTSSHGSSRVPSINAQSTSPFTDMNDSHSSLRGQSTLPILCSLTHKTHFPHLIVGHRFGVLSDESSFNIHTNGGFRLQLHCPRSNALKYSPSSAESISMRSAVDPSSESLRRTGWHLLCSTNWV